MSKGRKSIPSKIIDLRGGTRHTHQPPRNQEPAPPEKMPTCPKHLDKNARIEWKRAGKIMQSIGLMTELDRAVFAGYCDAFSQWAEATAKVHEGGLVYKKPDGTPGLNPYLRVAREAYDRMMKAAVLLGLSPSSRASLKVERPKPKSKAEEFMGRRARGK
jgi:P27 family predicted phage terminase small subunit